MLCAHTSVICVHHILFAYKSFLRVQNSVYTYTIIYTNTISYDQLCTRPYLGGGGGLASYFINTIL